MLDNQIIKGKFCYLINIITVFYQYANATTYVNKLKAALYNITVHNRAVIRRQGEKVSTNRRETQNKWPLGRDLDRSWCHHNTNVKLFWSVSMEPFTAIKNALSQCGGDTSSCPGPYHTTTCPQYHIGCWLDQELFTWPSYK